MHAQTASCPCPCVTSINKIRALVTNSHTQSVLPPKLYHFTLKFTCAGYKQNVSHLILSFPCKFTLNLILELLNICFVFFVFFVSCFISWIQHIFHLIAKVMGKKKCSHFYLSLCLSGYFWCKCLKCSLGECKSAFVFSWCIRLRYSLTGTFLVHAPAHKHTKVCHALIPQNMQLSE